jgi:hypothetical protein
MRRDSFFIDFRTLLSLRLISSVVCILVFLWIPLFAAEMTNKEPMKYKEIIEEENVLLNEALAKAAYQYVTILNKIGESESDCPSEEIMPLCTRNCKKVRNGKLLFEGRELFAAQLDAGKEWLGVWSINVQEVLISADNQTAAIRYELATEKEGDLVVIVVLHFDSNYLINEINEVHNKMEK